MRRSNQLIVESAAIASVMIMLTLGGSVATTIVPGSFLPLQNPAKVTAQYDLSGIAQYYNVTLTQIGSGNFANASFLLSTFRFVDLPSGVNATAQGANADLRMLNTTIPQAQGIFASARAATQANQLMNATALMSAGCALVKNANRTFADFSGPETTSLNAESVPTSQYATGEKLVSGEIQALQGECLSTASQGKVPTLVIGSGEKSVETGGRVDLSGNLTEGGVGVAEQKVLFYINGSYFGTLVSNSRGMLSGNLKTLFVYFPTAEVQALVAPNSTIGTGEATSNRIYLSILFNQTSITIGDPPAYLPGSSFNVGGNLTADGVPLPNAPVIVTYLGDSLHTFTDGSGTFGARFTVPDNATDGVYHVYARFASRGVFGPSVNFTSIEVYHLGLNLSLAVPGISWAGFSTHIGGTATSNGTAVADATVTLNSPWGSSTTTTDSEGHFTLTFPISPIEFAFSRDVTVSASPSQPYIGSSTAVANLGLFNILLVILPTAVIGVSAYEANSLGVFQSIAMRMRRRQTKGGISAPAGAISLEVPPVHRTGPEPLEFLGRALELASARFSIGFRQSQTIREILSQVRAKDDGEAYVVFSKILLTAEDFLYGRGFDPVRTDETRREMKNLEALWS
jgi:hypothetical protein